MACNKNVVTTSNCNGAFIALILFILLAIILGSFVF